MRRGATRCVATVAALWLGLLAPAQYADHSRAHALGARMTNAKVAFEDHPNGKRYAGMIETMTLDSVFAWMPRAGLVNKPLVTQR